MYRIDCSFLRCVRIFCISLFVIFFIDVSHYIEHYSVYEVTINAVNGFGNGSRVVVMARTNEHGLSYKMIIWLKHCKRKICYKNLLLI